MSPRTPDTQDTNTGAVSGAPTAPNSVRVRVPEGAGDRIVINTFDGPLRRFAVNGGIVEVDDQADADLLLRRVDGAALA